MKSLFTFFFCSCIISVVGQTKTSIEKFTQSPNLSHSSIGICIKDFDGKDIASLNKEISLTPASTLKVLTTATATELLGDDFQFRTEICTDKDDPQHIIIKGFGDPTLGSEHINKTPSAFLEEWTSEINKISTLNKNKLVSLTIVDDYFSYDGISQKWLQEDIGNYFAAGAYGISIFDNCYRLYFNTTKVDSCPSIIKTIPEIKNLVFLNTMTLNNTGRDNGYINGEPFSNYRTLIGSIPAKKTSFLIKGSIPDPGLMLGQTLSDRLMINGYKINKLETIRDLYYQQRYSNDKNLFEDADIHYKYLSPSLKEIIRVVNVKSNNHYAEHLIRAIGRTTNKDIYSSALNEGVNATKNYWTNKGLNMDALHMYDGCGLSPSNSVSPETLCNILLYMQKKSKYAESFLASFAKAGREGTVKNFLKGSRLEGFIYVKSGSIANVQCFAGYYINGEKRYAFTIMVNNFNSPHREIVKAIESLLLGIF